MSAAELLKRVKALPLAERRKFLKSVAKLDQPTKSTKPKPKHSPVKPIHWPDIEARQRRIFGDRPPGPNPVLIEREEWDRERGT